MTLQTQTFRDDHGTRWRVSASWFDRLFSGAEFLPESRVAERRSLKRTESRSVEEVTLTDGATVIVKRYEHRSGLEGLKRLLPHGAARIEWDHGVALMKAGLPCAEPVAFGRARAEDDERAAEILVTRRIDDARELGEWWDVDSGLHVGDRRDLVRAFARLVRRLHDAGVAHEDPHLGNFLGRRGSSGWEVFPIDLRRLRSGGRLGPSGRDAHLLLLYQTMGGVVSRTDRLRFLSTYLEHSPESERRAHATRLEDEGERQARRYRRRRAASALGQNRRFEVIDGEGAASGIRWHVRTSLRDAALEELLRDPEAAFASPDRVLKDGGSAQVVTLGRWVVKRMKPRHARHFVLDRVRRGKALTAMRMAFLMEMSDLATPRVAAAGKRVAAGVVARSYLISEFVPDALHVDVALETLRDDRPAVLKATGALVGRLHAENLTHRDLKAGNLIIDAGLRPWFVDLDGVRMRSQVRPARRAHDLARLFRDLRARADIQPAEERIFVASYVRAAGLPSTRTSPLLALIERAPRLRPDAPPKE